MILLQAGRGGFIGYGLGVGARRMIGDMDRHTAKLAFYMPWQVLVGTGVAVMAMARVGEQCSRLGGCWCSSRQSCFKEMGARGRTSR